MNKKNRTTQTSLADGENNEETKLRQTKIAELRRKYRVMAVILVGIMAVAVILLLTRMAPGSQEPIEVTVDNWSDYFVISKETVDTSIVLGDTGLYSMQTNYTIRLKDYYVEYLDTEQTSTVSFSVTYQECMGLFVMDYKNLTYKEPDSFSAVKNGSVNVVLKYPQSANSQSNLIYSASILGGGEQDDDTGIGNVGREFVVTSAKGTLYLKAER